MNSELLGIWRSDPDDPQTQAAFGDISLEFKTNGELEYIVYEYDRKQIISMSFEVIDNYIISDQSSAPGKVKTEFKIGSDQRLELILDGIKSSYIKV
jgi:hypothetical protein